MVHGCGRGQVRGVDPAPLSRAINKGLLPGVHIGVFGEAAVIASCGSTPLSRVQPKGHVHEQS